jgi:hypothetical protein
MPRHPRDTTTENPVKLAALQYLALEGHFCWRNNTGMASYGTRKVAYGKVGSADILGCHKDSGKLIAIETKRPDGTRKATDKQKEFLRAVLACGGLAGVAHDLDDVKQILAGHGAATFE